MSTKNKVLNGVDHSESPEDLQRPLSPATPAEHFFLPNFPPSDISALALAANLKHFQRPIGRRSANTSVVSFASDDFHSCVEYLDSEAPKNIRVIQEDFQEENSFYSLGPPETEIMAEVKTEETTKITLDPSQHLYGGIKNVWGFGSSFILTKPFAKVTEAVAGKLLDITTGMEFSGVDEEVKPKLAEIDNAFLNPAISRVIEIVEPVVKKVQSIVHPVAETLLSTVGLKKNKAIESDALEIKKKEIEIIAPEMTGEPMN